MSHDDDEWLGENPIPPPPSGTGANRLAWFEKTFPVGTPVIFRGDRNITIGDWSIPDGVKGEVVEIHDFELQVRLFPPVPGDPRFRKIERKLAEEEHRRRTTGYSGDRPAGQRATRVEDLDVYVSIDGAVAGFIEPLIDTWGDEPTHTPRYRMPHGRRARLKPNRARPLKGASMATKFGEDVEELDDLGGKDGRDLDAAMDRYETFHKKAPIRVAELEHNLPKSWVPVGDALAVMYRTDKWKKDGNDIDYKHLHDKGEDKPYDLGRGVKFYEPASEANKSRVQGRRTSRPNKKRPQRLSTGNPEALTLLGYCLGVFVRRYDDPDEVYEINPRGCYLFSSPSGNMLAMYSPTEGFLAAMAGGNLRVLRDGIDG